MTDPSTTPEALARVLRDVDDCLRIEPIGDITVPVADLRVLRAAIARPDAPTPTPADEADVLHAEHHLGTVVPSLDGCPDHTRAEYEALAASLRPPAQPTPAGSYQREALARLFDDLGVAFPGAPREAVIDTVMAAHVVARSRAYGAEREALAHALWSTPLADQDDGITRRDAESLADAALDDLAARPSTPTPAEHVVTGHCEQGQGHYAIPAGDDPQADEHLRQSAPTVRPDDERCPTCDGFVARPLAAPTVTTEQVRVAMLDALKPQTNDYRAAISDAAAQVASDLRAALGIEVTR